MKHRSLFNVLMATVFCFIPLVSQAQSDLERQYLTLLANEIKALEAVINKAEVNRDKDARLPFKYEWIRADIKQMRAAILRHLNAPRAVPRKVAPLHGEYRQ